MVLKVQPRARKPSLRVKANAVAALAEKLDTNFFKAIAEPVRQQIVLILLKEGRSNVQQVAEHLVQDRSVISRHLALRACPNFCVNGSDFNGRLRRECLNASCFMSLDDAQTKIKAWRKDYEESRPHSALD